MKTNAKIIVKVLTITVLTIILMFTESPSLKAVIAYPYPIEVIQPDGSKLMIIKKGDEFSKSIQTLDGFTLTKNTRGNFEYARLNDSGDLVPSGIQARNIKERKRVEKNFLSSISKGLKYSEKQVVPLKSTSSLNNTKIQNSFPTKGKGKLLCILINFKDIKFTKTQSDFQNLFNQEKYSTAGASGSVRDYYLENSYGQLDLSVTVAGPFTASQNMEYYGANYNNEPGADINPGALVTEAIKLADATVNYKDFDNDGNGEVDAIYVIFAGNGEEADPGTSKIWSHASSITPLYLDGKIISRYSCSPELRSNSGTGITRIGVICHEFGHILGASDFYDTNKDDDGLYDGTGNWDLMASGTWNNEGATPAHQNPYTKIYELGWATAKPLPSGSITLASAEKNSNDFYKLNTKTSDEYFIIENRQQQNFDKYIPGHGMIIYHVDGNGINYGGNGINTNNHQNMYPVCANANGNPPSEYGVSYNSGLPFPGTDKKTSFSDSTIPNSISWAGAESNIPITNITENTATKTISFTVGSTLPDLIISAGTQSANPVSLSGGSTLSVSCSEENKGGKSAGSNHVTLWLSSDDYLTPSGDVYLGQISFSSVSANSCSIVKSTSVKIPSSISIGKYYLFFWADGNKIVTESNEDNNFASVKITVAGGGGSSDDFYVQNTYVTPATVAAGKTIDTNCDQYYSGTTTDANMDNCYLGYYLSTNTSFEPSTDIYLDEDYSGLGSDDISDPESATLTIPKSTSAGKYYILFVADYYGAFKETNENNNVAYVQITVTGGGSSDDFYVQNAYVTPATVAAGKTIDTNCDQYYSGTTTDANMDNCYLGYYLSTNTSFEPSTDIYLDEDYSGLGSDDISDPESATLTIPKSTSAGKYYILFVADYNGAFKETNENNNVAYVQITVTGGGSSDDFYVQNAYVTPTTVAAGKTIDTNCDQYYSGTTTDANMDNCYLGYYLSTNTSFEPSTDIYLDEDYSGLGSDDISDPESATLTIPKSTSAGKYYILFVADYNGAFKETNENNNVAYVQITVTGGGSSDDFYVQNTYVTPTTVAAGKTIDTNCDQYYSGTTIDANMDNCYLGYYLSANTSFEPSTDIYLDEDYSGLGSDDLSDPESATLTIPKSTSAGKYYILFVADYNGAFKETNENNNVAYVQITVTGGGSSDDFYVQNAYVTPTTVAAGKTIDTNCDQYYSGTTTDANMDNCYLGYYLSTNTSFEPSTDIYLDEDYSGLGSDDISDPESATLTIPKSTSAGKYYILFVADYNGAFKETNENNNVAYVQITVTGGGSSDDFYVQNTYVTPTTVAAGKTIDTNCDQYYSGTTIDANMDNCYLGYYLSANTSFEPSTDIYLDEDYSGLGSDDLSDPESATLTIPKSTSAGKYYILFVADYNGAFKETNENNNVAYVQITVTSSKSSEFNSVDSTIETISEFNFHQKNSGINNLNLFPNPTKGLCEIKLDETIDGFITIQIFNYTGSLVQRFDLTYKSGPIKIDLSGQRSGIYIVKISDKGNILTGKVLKE